MYDSLNFCFILLDPITSATLMLYGTISSGIYCRVYFVSSKCMEFLLCGRRNLCFYFIYLSLYETLMLHDTVLSFKNLPINLVPFIFIEFISAVMFLTTYFKCDISISLPPDF